jgi:mannose-6-phosphate isomerase-like protein (cupin superfamily)
MRIQILMLGLILPLIGAEPAGYKHWTPAELKERTKALSPKIDAHKIATERLANFGNYHALAVHREGSGQAEFHEHWADLFVVQSGSATLVVGGTIPNGKTTAPGEIRGPKIEGGTAQRLSSGDIVHVPAKTPHQFLFDPGTTEFDAFVLKIKQ